jgi:hypothetical protein
MKKYWTLLQKNEKKEFAFVAAVMICVFLLASSMFLVASIILSVVILVVMLSVTWMMLEEKYRNEYLHLQLQRQYALMHSFSLLKVLLFQGLTPYQALKQSLGYIPEVLIDPFSQLLLRIEVDKTIAPYMTIAKVFNSLVIEQLFLTIYQLEGHGGYQSLHHFEYIFEQSDLQFHQKTLQHLKQHLSGNLSLAMIGTGILTFSLLIGIIGMIGDLIHGI